jgi:hypothetical protein
MLNLRTIGDLEPPAGLETELDASILIATAGPAIQHGAIGQEGSSPLTPLTIERGAHGSVLYANRIPWNGVQPLDVRLRMGAIGTSAGYGACYATTPQLFEPSTVNTAWEAAHRTSERYLGTHNLTSFDPGTLVAAVVDVSVAHEVPDRGALDANGVIAEQAVRVACSSSPAEKQETNPAATTLLSATRSNCGSTQTFRSSNAAAILNGRVFGAGLALSAAVAILLEAVFSAHRSSRERSDRESSPDPESSEQEQPPQSEL